MPESEKGAARRFYFMGEQEDPELDRALARGVPRVYDGTQGEVVVHLPPRAPRPTSQPSGALYCMGPGGKLYRCGCGGACMFGAPCVNPLPAEG